MLETISGKQPTITAAFRLPISEYQRVKSVAQHRNEKLSVTLRRLVARGLEAEASGIEQGQQGVQDA